MKESCENCKFLVRFNCHRHAPVISELIYPESGIKNFLTLWPEVRESNWCGDWEINRDKTNAS